MKALQFHCRGVSPLLMQYYSQEEWDDVLITRIRSHPRPTLSVREQAEKRLCRNEQGIIGFYDQAMLGVMDEAFNKLRAEGALPFRARGHDTVCNYAVVKDDFIPLLGPTGKTNPAWKVDLQRGVTATHDVITVVRPRFDQWQIVFQVTYDENKLRAKMVRDIVKAAGRCVGLGSYTPRNRGPYGRFGVEEVTVVTSGEAALCAA